MLRIKEEEERRKEVATKFQTTLSEVSSLLQQNNEKNNKLREENSEMATKLQMLCDQYTLREQHLDKLGNDLLFRFASQSCNFAGLSMNISAIISFIFVPTIRTINFFSLCCYLKLNSI